MSLISRCKIQRFLNKQINIWNIPNLLSLFRILAAPVLLFLVLDTDVKLFKWLLTAAFFTDLVDGWLARRLHQVTRLGSVLDSVGDSLTIIVGTFGLIYLRPDLYYSYNWVIIAVIGLHIIQLCLSLWRYGKPSSFHTYSAKVAAFGIGSFLLLTFHFGFFPVAFYIAVGLLVVDAIEESIMVFIVPEWRHDVKGLFWIRKREKEGSGDISEK